MSLKSVVSSTVISRDYNPLTRDLDVVFKNGNRGTYKDVPAKTVDEFDEAKSPGTFLNQNLKNVFSYKKGGAA